MSDLTVANTILQQLTQQSSPGRATAVLSSMIGAHNFAGDGKSVQFKWRAKAKQGANSVVITLDPSDTYTMQFWKLGRGLNMTMLKELDGLYDDTLKRSFESFTGLYLSF